MFLSCGLLKQLYSKSSSKYNHNLVQNNFLKSSKKKESEIYISWKSCLFKSTSLTQPFQPSKNNPEEMRLEH